MVEQFQSKEDPPNAMDTMTNMTSEASSQPITEEYLRSLDLTSLPAHGSIAHIPAVRSVYHALRVCYQDFSISDAVYTLACKRLATTLLGHYFPETQGYTVEPTAPGPTAERGVSFILVTDGVTEDNSQEPQPKSQTKKKSKKQSAATKPKTFTSNQALQYTYGLTFEFIQPENITSYTVKRKIQSSDPNTKVTKLEDRIHTSLIILMNRSSGTFDRPHSKDNAFHRGDMFADILCQRGNIESGFGILIHGPRLEFYDYRAGPKWVYHDNGGKKPRSRKEEIPNYKGSDLGPFTSLIRNDETGNEDLVFDMRHASLELIDQAFRTIASRRVTYLDLPQAQNGNGYSHDHVLDADAMQGGPVLEKTHGQIGGFATIPENVLREQLPRVVTTTLIRKQRTGSQGLISPHHEPVRPPVEPLSPETTMQRPPHPEFTPIDPMILAQTETGTYQPAQPQ